MMKLKHALLGFAAIVLTASTGFSHCQIPCGIYDDGARFTELAEHVTTLRKSVKLINELSIDPAKTQNQLVRWVQNKEEHADKISDIALKYFLAQRIKEGQDHYKDKLVALHKIIVGAMKVKQTSDATKVDELEKAIKAFQSMYEHKH